MSEKIYHKELAGGKWQTLSLVEQMGNIGTEVGRAVKYFKQADKESCTIAFEKALELFDLTLDDDRWKGRRKEIARCREVFCSLLFNAVLTDELQKQLDLLNEYFLWFGTVANERRRKVRHS